MRVGVQMVFQSYGYGPDVSDGQVVDDEVRLGMLADELGFDALWPVEHHFADYAFCPDNTVFLSSGDNHIPGPFFNAADDASLAPELGATGAGRGDIEILNLMGLQASAVGNHDLDLGTNFFAALINASGGWRGARFPYLSANLGFDTDSNLAARVVADGGDAATQANRLAGSAG